MSKEVPPGSLVPMSIEDRAQKLTPGAFRLLEWMKERANARWFVRMKQDDVAGVIDSSVRSVGRHLAELQSMGLVDRRGADQYRCYYVTVLGQRWPSNVRICASCRRAVPSTRHAGGKHCPLCKQSPIGREDRAWKVVADAMALEMTIGREVRTLDDAEVMRIHYATGRPLYGPGDTRGPESESLVQHLMNGGWVARPDQKRWRARRRRYRGKSAVKDEDEG